MMLSLLVGDAVRYDDDGAAVAASARLAGSGGRHCRRHQFQLTEPLQKHRRLHPVS